MKRFIQIALVCAACVGIVGCADDAHVASTNLSKAADNFEVDRRIVFYNGITGEYMLTIRGRCSIDDEGASEFQGAQLEVICKVGDGEYKKHFLGLSDNVTYFAEQGESVAASAYHYRVTFKPQALLPDFDFRGSVSDGPRAQ